jgi:hypothetical protein
MPTISEGRHAPRAAIGAARPRRTHYPDLSPAAAFAAPFKLAAGHAGLTMYLRGRPLAVVEVPREPGDEALKLIELVAPDGSRTVCEDRGDYHVCDCPEYRRDGFDCEHLQGLVVRRVFPKAPTWTTVVVEGGGACAR